MRLTPPPPPTCSLSADPPAIDQGNATTLNFTSLNADYGIIEGIPGVVFDRGSRSVSPAATTTYVAKFSGRSGTATCFATVNVRQPQPPPFRPAIASFTIHPTSIVRGERATLSWSVAGASSVRVDNGIGKVFGNSITVSPSLTMDYTLTAENGAGTVTAKASITVREPLPPSESPVIASFEAQPSSIRRGESAALSWSVTGATSVRIDNDVGAVAGTSATVSPETTATYVLTAENAVGSVTAGATVTVMSSEEIVLPKVECGKLVLSRQGGKSVVEGFVGYDKDFEAVRASAPGAEIDVKIRPWPQCEALQTLDRALSLPDPPTVAVRRPTGDELMAGDPLVFDIQTPSYPSYLHVAYIQADGSVVNLIQPGDGSFKTYGPRSKVTIGANAGGGRRFFVQGPYGREMLIVLVGRSPVFPDRRPRLETEREFLTALRRALLAKPDVDAPDRDIVASFDAVVTKEK